MVECFGALDIATKYCSVLKVPFISLNSRIKRKTIPKFLDASHCFTVFQYGVCLCGKFSKIHSHTNI